eukprot:Sdes_comp18075_c0_seq1m7485
MGLSDMPGEATCMLFCPNCHDLYYPKSSRHRQIDGAYFGTTFPHMLFAVHPHLRPVRTFVEYVPRIYGFKIHPSAYEIDKPLETATNHTASKAASVVGNSSNVQQPQQSTSASSALKRNRAGMRFINPASQS